MDHWKTMLYKYSIASLLFPSSHSQSSSNQRSGKPQVILYFKMWHFSWFLLCRVAAIVSVFREYPKFRSTDPDLPELCSNSRSRVLFELFFSKSILCNWQLTSESSLVFNFLPTTLPFKQVGVNCNGRDI